MLKVISVVVFLLFFCPHFSYAKTVSYDLTIAQHEVNVTGKKVQAMTVNGGIPGPVLYWNEGDQALIHVHNQMDVETSIHWHGLLLPNRQDGVSYLTTPPIKAHSTHTFHFPIIQSGTYWYHSHTGLQEQRGVFGSIVIQPRIKKYSHVQDEVLVLSDWTNENPHEVLRTLKSGSEYYSLKKKAMPSLYGAIKEKSLKAYLANAITMMPPMDISDVGYDAFLINGKKERELEAKPGQWVRLRIINAGSSTYFYLEYAKGPFKVIAADGMDVEPFETNRLLIATAETYDILIQVPSSEETNRYELRATAHDGSGFASYFIGPKNAKTVRAPVIPRPNLYTMEHDMDFMDPDQMKNMHHMSMNHKRPGSVYARLKSLQSTALDPCKDFKVVKLNLTGDMHRYLWTFNGKTLNEEDKILVKKGENVRFVMVNKTMMHHPIHLHGHFFRVVNEYGDYSPLKHTVNVPPHGKVIIEFAADKEKDWFFHCHLLYHMMSGMHRIVHYEGTQVDADISALRHHLYHNHFYTFGYTRLLSQMSEGIFQISNDRNDVIAEWENNWKGEFEVEGVYSRYFNRYISAFAGLEGTDHDTAGIGGAKLFLPLLLEGRARVDTKGDFQFSLEREIALLPRLIGFGRLRYDTEEKWEWKAGGEIMLAKHLSLVGEYHSHYGAGGGLKFIF